MIYIFQICRLSASDMGLSPVRTSRITTNQSTYIKHYCNLHIDIARALCTTQRIKNVTSFAHLSTYNKLHVHEMQRKYLTVRIHLSRIFNRFNLYLNQISLSLSLLYYLLFVVSICNPSISISNDYNFIFFEIFKIYFLYKYWNRCFTSITSLF